ncbi:MAG TPA: type II toxin-antitoxin system ParD family antitoxin [Pirellulales bacterium]|nr:type II toxin-antitoxin system ParD family antitoxin [Pirellulales bacterium]
MSTYSIQVSLPESVKSFVDAEVASGGYGTASDYLVTVILAEQRRKAKVEIEALLLEGLDSGLGVEATAEFWEQERREMGLPPRHASPS